MGCVAIPTPITFGLGLHATISFQGWTTAFTLHVAWKQVNRCIFFIVVISSKQVFEITWLGHCSVPQCQYSRFLAQGHDVTGSASCHKRVQGLNKIFWSDSVRPTEMVWQLGKHVTLVSWVWHKSTLLLKKEALFLLRLLVLASSPMV